MSGGRSARFGFLYSDLVVIRRILEHLLQRRVALIDGRELPISPVFHVESTIAPDNAPDWDILEERVAQVRQAVLEEVKSGPLKAKDRRTFWRRIRRTVSRLDAEGGVQVIPRLTTNRDNPTEHQDRWGEFRVAVDQCAEVPETSPDFTSAKALAKEAIYHLTHVTDDSQDEGEKELKDALGQTEQIEQPLSLERARCVLGAFEFNNALGADALEGEVKRLVGLLSFGLPVKELCANLIGELYRRAAAEESSVRRFTADEILFSLSTLKHLSEVAQDDARIWQSWSRLSESTMESRLDSQRALGLPYQDWHEVQPAVAKALENGVPPLLALIGRGGLGKSVLLGRLRQHSKNAGSIVILLSGFDLQGKTPRQVGSVLGLGAFVSSVERKSLHVLVDAIENAADGVSELHAFIASLGEVGGLEKVHVTLSMRAVTWGRLAGSQEKIPRWVVVELSDWREDRVSTLVRGSQRPGISPELLRLLCTPLLLDLFLRTFGVAEAVPAGIQTRHAVMSAYWERRVLPPDNPDSDRRRKLLAHCCSEEAKGRSRHTVVGSVMHQLASEGVFFQQYGAWSFRHPLIRDFAMMQWAAMRGNSPGDIVAALGGVADSLSRWGAIRAAIEAAGESAVRGGLMPSIEELVRGMSRGGQAVLMAAAEVLGQLDDPSVVNLGRVLGSISPAESAAGFVERLFDLARLDENAAWIRWIVSLPSSAEWAETTPWVGRRFLHLIIEWLDVVSRNWAQDADSSVAALGSACALRVRNWSAAPKFGVAVAGEHGFNWLKLASLVAKFLPNQDTLNWMAVSARGTMWARYATLNVLPVVVSGARSKGEALDGQMLVDVYCEASNLVRSASGLCDGPESTALPNGDYMRTQVALLGHDSAKRGHRGLLRETPEVFLPVALDMLSGFSEAERAEQEAHPAPLDEAASAVLEADPPLTEVDEAERRLKEAYPPSLSEKTVLSGLVDDTGYRGYATEPVFIMNDLENMVEDDLEAGGNFVENIYWPVARKSHSVASWLILLEALSDRALDYSDLIDDLLVDRPLYFIRDARFHLHKALSSRWPLLGAEKRKLILKNIESVARANWMGGIYVVASLASAIPSDERPAWMHPFFEVYRLRRWDPVPSETDLDVSTGVILSSLHPAESDKTVVLSPWGKVARRRLGQLDPKNDAFLDALRELKSALTCELPEPEEAIEGPDLLQALYELFGGVDWRRRIGGAIPSELELNPDEIRRLIRWSFEVLWRCRLGKLAVDRTPVKAQGTPASGSYHPWVVALEFVGRALRRPEVNDDLGLNRALFEEIDRRLTNSPPGLVWYIFRAIGPYHWVREGSAGSGLLKNLVFGRIRDPGALVRTFRHAWALGGADSRKAFYHWLCEQDALAGDGDLEGFARESGIFMGHCAFVLDRGEPNSLRRLVNELLLQPPEQGLLSRVKEYREWCLGVAFGAKDEIRRIGAKESPGIYADFALLMGSIWERVKTRMGDECGALFVVYFLHALEPEPASAEVPAEESAVQRRSAARLLWRNLEPVVLKVAAEGHEADVYDLVSGVLREGLVSVLAMADLVELVDALHARAVSWGARLNAGIPRRGHGWLDVFDSGAELVMAVATSQGATPEVKGRFHEMLQEWAALGIPRAPEMARLIRV